MTSSPKKSFSLFHVVLIGILFGSILFFASGLVPLDHDEVEHTHAGWLLSQNLIPFKDFSEFHLPFFWILISPVMKILPESFDSLLYLRWMNIPCSLTLIFLLIFLIKGKSNDLKGFLLASLAVFVMACQSDVLEALVEFRADHISFVFLLSGILVLQRFQEKNKPFQVWMASTFLFLVGLFLDPKRFALIPLIFFIFGWEQFKRNKSLLREALGIFCGTLLSIMVAISILKIFKIDIRNMLDLSFGYHLILSQRMVGGISFLKVLLLEMASPPFLLALFIIGGLITYFQKLKDRSFIEREIPFIFLFFCLSQLLMIKFPYKQYTYSLFLSWAGLLFLFFNWVDQKFKKSLFLFILIAIVPAIFKYNFFSRIYSNHPLLRQLQFENELLRLAPKNKPVLATPPMHPIFRKDSAYTWVYSLVPGVTTDDAMSQFPDYKNHFTVDGILKEIMLNPPGFISLNAPYASETLIKAANLYIHQYSPTPYKVNVIGDTVVYTRETP